MTWRPEQFYIAHYYSSYISNQWSIRYFFCKQKNLINPKSLKSNERREIQLFWREIQGVTLKNSCDFLFKASIKVQTKCSFSLCASCWMCVINTTSSRVALDMTEITIQAHTTAHLIKTLVEKKNPPHYFCIFLMREGSRWPSTLLTLCRWNSRTLASLKLLIKAFRVCVLTLQAVIN